MKLLLYGDLARRFGRFWEFNTTSPDKAMKALFANCPAAKKYFLDRPNHPYRVFVGDSGVSVGLDEVYASAPGATVRLVPALRGAKSQGVGQIIMGAVIFIVGAVVTYYGGGAGAKMMEVGAVMMLGGVVQLIFAVAPPGQPKEKDANKPSYLFSGPVNTVAQGQRIPVGYGRLRVGSAVINAGIRSDDYGSAGGVGSGAGSGTDGDRCVTVDTPILTNRGYRPASEIKHGTLLYTQHEDTQVWGFHFVTQVELAAAECLKVVFEDGRFIECSCNHQFLLVDTGLGGYRWCEARHLAPGDKLEGPEQSIIKSFHRIGLRDVIKFQVDEAHTYITNGVLSHNVKVRIRYD